MPQIPGLWQKAKTPSSPPCTAVLGCQRSDQKDHILASAVQFFDSVLRLSAQPGATISVFFSIDPRHTLRMTKLLEQAVSAARNLPTEMQDDIARMMLSYAGDDERIIELSPEEEADLIEAQAEMARGEFATEAEVQTILSKYRL